MARFWSPALRLCISGHDHHQEHAVPKHKYACSWATSNLFVSHHHTNISITSSRVGVKHEELLLDEDEDGSGSGGLRPQNIPEEKQLVDPYRQGIIVEDGVVYRQTLVIRSYEVGPDMNVNILTLLSFLQETALNHVWMSGLLSDGFGATHGMTRNNLIWVVSKLHLQVHHYPIWGEVVEIDTWIGTSGKNGITRDWLIRSPLTGLAFARATSTWVMMNKTTRRLSRMTDEVRAEISPWFTPKRALEEEDSPEKIHQLNETNASHVLSNLKPKRSDLDVNDHVNNIKYVKWMLETIPNELLENHQLSSIILEYRRECRSSDLVQSLCQQLEAAGANGRSAKIPGRDGRLGFVRREAVSYAHLLQITGKNIEILRGKTTWKKKVRA